MSTSEFSSFWPSSVSSLVTSSSSSPNASSGAVDECRPMVEYRKRLPLPAKITTTLVMMSAGTLGNTVALIVLCRTGAVEKSRTVFNTMLMALTATDLSGQVLASIPPLLTYALDLELADEDAACKLGGYVMVVFGLTTPLLLALMAVERAVCIARWDLYARLVTQRRARFLALYAWAFALVFAALPLFGLGEYRVNCPLTWCFLAFTSRRVLSRLLTGLFAAVVGAALVVSNSCNVFVIVMLLRYRRVRQHLLAGLVGERGAGGGDAGAAPSPALVGGADEALAFVGQRSAHATKSFDCSGQRLNVDRNDCKALEVGVHYTAVPQRLVRGNGGGGTPSDASLATPVITPLGTPRRAPDARSSGPGIWMLTIGAAGAGAGPPLGALQAAPAKSPRRVGRESSASSSTRTTSSEKRAFRGVLELHLPLPHNRQSAPGLLNVHYFNNKLSAKRGSSGSAGLKPSLGAHPHARNSLPTADGSASRASTLSPVVVAGGEVGGDGKVALMRISAGPHGPTMSAAVPRRRHQLIGPAVDIQMIILLCSVTAVFSYCWGQYIFVILKSVITGNMDVREMLAKVRWASLNQILDPFLFVLLRFSILWRAYRLIARSLRSMRRALCSFRLKDVAHERPSEGTQQTQRTCPYLWLRHHVAHRNQSHAASPICKLCAREFGGEPVGSRRCDEANAADGTGENGAVTAPECDGPGSGANEGPAAAGLRLGGSDCRMSGVGTANSAANSDRDGLRQQLQEQQSEHHSLKLQQKPKCSPKWHRVEHINERTESSAPPPPSPTPVPTTIPLMNGNSK